MFEIALPLVYVIQTLVHYTLYQLVNMDTLFFSEKLKKLYMESFKSWAAFRHRFFHNKIQCSKLPLYVIQTLVQWYSDTLYQLVNMDTFFFSKKWKKLYMEKF